MTQVQRIMEYMRNNDGITSMDAFRLGCTRLSARIADIEKMGHKVRRERATKDKVTFTRYHLEEVRKDG